MNKTLDLGVRYFSLEEYVKNIKVSNEVLEHLEYVEEEFDNYMKKLLSYDVDYITKYWIYLLYIEMKSSQKIENHPFDNIKDLSPELLVNNSVISHDRIHQIHDYAVLDDNKDGFSYRNVGVNVSNINEDETEKVFYRGVNSADINLFMDDFVKIYNHTKNEQINNSSILKSALLHMLFVAIHPYRDGNGRTARIIHNLKFTSSISHYYKVSLRLSPINLSKSLYINKITYINTLRKIIFDGKHDDNVAINKWFDFILNMTEEQIYTSSQKLDTIDRDFIKELNYLSQHFNRVNPKDSGAKELKKYYK